jgi:RNA polymerase sigma factor (sigma-70 family)
MNEIQTSNKITYDTPHTQPARGEIREAHDEAIEYWRVPVSELDGEHRSDRLLEEPMERAMLQTAVKHPPEAVNQSLLRRVQKDGDTEATNRLITENMRLVVAAARNRHGLLKNLRGDSSLGMEDLVQEGAIGLQEAIQKKQPVENFGSFGRTIVSSAQRTAIFNNASTVRIPLEQGKEAISTAIKVGDMIDEVRSAHDPKPSKVLASATDEMLGFFNDQTPTSKLSQIAEQYAKHYKADPADVYEWQRIQRLRRPLSLEGLQSVDGDNRREFIDHSPDVNPVETTEEAVTRSSIESAFEQLDDVQKQVLEMTYGLNGSEVHTLREMQEKLGFSNTKLRSIEKKALDTLKANPEFMRSIDRGTMHERSGVNIAREAIRKMNDDATTEAWRVRDGMQPRNVLETTVADNTPSRDSEKDQIAYLKDQFMQLKQVDETGQIGDVDPRLLVELVGSLEALKQDQLSEDVLFQIDLELGALKEVLEGVDVQFMPSLRITRLVVARRIGSIIKSYKASSVTKNS